MQHLFVLYLIQDLSLTFLAIACLLLHCSPSLTVVPKANSLDSITLDVRTSVYICTEIPIKIRIVRLGKSPGMFRLQKSKQKIDLTRKNLIPALRRVVEGKDRYFTSSVPVPSFSIPYFLIFVIFNW